MKNRDRFFLTLTTVLMTWAVTSYSQNQDSTTAVENPAPAVQSTTPSSAAFSPSAKRLDFKFPNSDIKSVFAALSIHAGVDIVPAPNISGKISLEVRNKTWNEVLDLICNLYEYTWLVEDKYIHVMRTSDYVRRETAQANKEVNELRNATKIRRTFILNHAQPRDVLPVVNSIVLEYTGNATINERNNAIVVNASERVMELVEDAIRDLDIETRQVVITAQLVVVDATTQLNLGVDWNVASGAGATQLDGRGSLPTTEPYDSRSKALLNVTPAGAPGLPVSSATLSLGILQDNVGLAISQYMNDEKSEVLAAPQVMTLDHTKATITMGEERSVRTVDAQGVAAITTMNAGIKLEVTPHITADGRVLLELIPENSSFTVDASSQIIKQEQKAQTSVLVNDGETVVIAGLTTNYETDVESGIPFLKDVPLLGHLFKHTRKEYTKKDLIIFVTPHIVKKKEEHFLHKSFPNVESITPSSDPSESRELESAE